MLTDKTGLGLQSQTITES